MYNYRCHQASQEWLAWIHQRCPRPPEIHVWGGQSRVFSCRWSLAVSTQSGHPAVLQSQIVDRILDRHHGVTKCLERNKTSVWWPAITTDIKAKVASCDHCQELQASHHKEPLLTTPLPSRPWHKVAVDLCQHQGQQYLVLVDYYSRLIELAHMTTTTSAQVVGKMKGVFTRWGIPEELVTDNGSQFTAGEFNEYGFLQTTTSPHYPQANGEAERAVQMAQKILAQRDPYLALLSYRSTPIAATGHCPAQLIMGRQIHSTLPSSRHVLQPKWPDPEKVNSKMLRQKHPTSCTMIATTRQRSCLHWSLETRWEWNCLETILRRSSSSQ